MSTLGKGEGARLAGSGQKGDALYYLLRKPPATAFWENVELSSLDHATRLSNHVIHVTICRAGGDAGCAVLDIALGLSRLV